MIAIIFAAAVATMPDPTLTPGVVRNAPFTLTQICTTKWGKDERAVTESMKLQVFHEYGYDGDHDPRLIPDAHGRTAEVDHLISRENGGADDVRNLWPEPYAGAWNASDKDRLENALHKDLCAGHKTFEQVWADLRDWQHAYVAEFGGFPADAN